MSSARLVVRLRLELLVSLAVIVCLASATGVTQNKLATSTNDFAFTLYREIGESNTGRNIFFSPVSVCIGLGMIHAGAAGQTKSQLATVMGLNDFTTDSTNVEFRNLLETLNAPGNNYTLLAANRLFGQEGFTFRKEFVQVTKDYYRAALESLNFAKDPEGSRVHINNWVAKTTEDKIRDLLPDGSIGDNTALVIVNAIYFKGFWSNPFSRDSTRQRTFHLSRTTLTSIEMMSADAKNLAYFDSARLGAAVLELPYVGGEASMYVFVPHDVEGLSSVEDRLNASSLAEVFRSMRSERVAVSLPKFVLEQGVALKQFLQNTGIVDMFDTVKADLSGIDGTRNLVVTEAMHKAFVAVDEEGTEAAAASGFVINVKSAGPSVIEFVADHPFLFLVVDTTTGSVLFLGRLTRPPQEGDGNIGVFGRTAELRSGGSSTSHHRATATLWLAAALLLLSASTGMRRGL